jgi:hypothetical protein
LFTETFFRVDRLARWGRYGAKARGVYRDNPRWNLRDFAAWGFAADAQWDLTPTWSARLEVHRDEERIRFVFPGRTAGDRRGVDLSVRWTRPARVVAMGKVRWQRDRTDTPFFPGEDFEAEREGGETLADGILQSLRFLEDADYNYRKVLAIGYLLVRPAPSLGLETVVLWEGKRFDERVLEDPRRPRRTDRTWVVQGGFRSSLRPALELVGFLRVERRTSNDPDHPFDLTTFGLGLEARR